VRRLKFELKNSDGLARRGALSFRRGTVQTPAFMPVGTYGTVKSVTPAQLLALDGDTEGAQIILGNTYHLMLRPGPETVAALGGLHKMAGWNRAILTDSGGYQVFSLAKNRTLDDDGVTFQSHLDGNTVRLTPASAMRIQHQLDSDIAMVLDECQPSQSDESQLRAAAERTLRWAERSARARSRSDQAVFGIVQGGTETALRGESARQLSSLGFEGYAHGGLGLGEEPEQREDLVRTANELLPASAPRYLMGIGYPADLVDGIAAGVDLFDCVIPTRHARHGVLFTRTGTLKIKNASFRDDPAPPDEDCDCSTCAHHSRAYLHHLLRVQEMLGPRLMSIHNLRYYLNLMEEARAAIRAGTFSALHKAVREIPTR